MGACRRGAMAGAPRLSSFRPTKAVDTRCFRLGSTAVPARPPVGQCTRWRPALSRRRPGEAGRMCQGGLFIPFFLPCTCHHAWRKRGHVFSPSLISWLLSFIYILPSTSDFHDSLWPLYSPSPLFYHASSFRAPLLVMAEFGGEWLFGRSWDYRARGASEGLMSHLPGGFLRCVQ